MDVDKNIPHEIFKNTNILKRIFLFIANENLNDNKFTNNKDLVKLLFVCKTWYKIAVPLLYSKIIYNGGITRGVFQGNYTRLETISQFISNNKKQSDDFHIYNYINNIKEPLLSSIITNNWKDNVENLKLKIDFTSKEENLIIMIDINVLRIINKIIGNINSLKINKNNNNNNNNNEKENDNETILTESKIKNVQKINEQLFEELSDTLDKF
ncbi:hypothetical protein BCR32DRAFT_302268, partial [Anaeromyces robustus]